MIKKNYFQSFQQGMTLIELSVVLLILIALAGLAAPYVGGISSSASCQATDATMHAIKEAIMGGAAGTGFYGDTLGSYPANKGGSDYNLKYLFAPGLWPLYNAKTAIGWRGPYLTNGAISPSGLDDSFSSVYANPTEPTPNPTGKVHDSITTNTPQILDGWHRPIVLQIPYNKITGKYVPEYARLVSAGPTFSGSAIDTKIQYDSTYVDSSGVPHPLPDALDRNDDRVLYLRMSDPLPGGNTACDES